MTIKLTSPRITCVFGEEDDPDTWTELVVQTLNVDQLAYERQAAKSGWKGMEHAPFQWLTFMAWHALHRKGIVGASMEDWDVLSVTAETEDTATPTPPAG